MHCEPVGYIVEYELGALAVFLVILLRYFGARRFPNQRNSLFALLLWATVGDMLLDVVSSLTIDHAALLPPVITYLVNAGFYLVTIFMLVLMMLYAMALAAPLTRKRLRRNAALFVPGLVFLGLLASNPFTRWLFYVDPEQGYVHGPVFIVIYVACFIYLGFTFAVAVKNRKRLRQEEYVNIIRFLVVVLVSTVVQYYVPVLLITGVAIALAVVLMYFTIQNPETMLDTTTGAFTSEAMMAFLQDRVQERDQIQLAAVKIYNMSRINELLGIENGSVLLTKVSGFMRSSGEDVWVFRMRGSCFVAITRRQEDYQALCAGLEQRVGQPWTVGGTEVLLQAAVCCVAVQDLLAGPISPQETVNYLETAFQQSEQAGSRVVTINAGGELLAKVSRSRAVEAALRNALNTGEGLELYFQPLWSVREERFDSAEVLLRFQHPVLGSISPEEFVPIAESNGLVTTMDELVVRKACAFLRRENHCRSLGLETLEINLSALEFMHRRLPALLEDIMEEYGTDPGFLCFEITETAATESFELLKECMQAICRFGCRFALDDFGTGYANISQVIQLPFSMVKLDKSLLHGPPAVLEDLAGMFARMGRQTVAEGVETAVQAALVRTCQVDHIQGYYYAKPMNGEDFLQFLQNCQNSPQNVVG